MFFRRKLGKAFEELRKSLGLTQEELGRVFDVSGNTVSTWETTGNYKHIYYVLLTELVAKKYTYRTVDEMKCFTQKIIKSKA